jgi:predicted nucleotidyltransferase
MALNEPLVRVLYGSHARGAADERSDLDVLLIADDSSVEQQLKEDSEQAISRYRWPEFLAMHKYGSLFLQHLRLEGRVIDGNDTGILRYRHLLASIPPYTKASENIRSFRLALDDIASALRYRDSSSAFEASALASLLRHSAILGCYSIGEMNFGRYSAVSHFCSRRALPAEIAQEYPLLYDYRLAMAGLCPLPSVQNYDFVQLWHRRAEILVEETARVSARSMYR